MRVLALSRTCALTDFPNCHTVERWQQAMAEAACAVWRQQPGWAWCVNASPARFFPPLDAYVVNDPAAEVNAPDPLVAIFALSVFDHVEAPVGFLTSHGRRLIAGGLVFCTFDAWDAEGPDCAEGHADRRRLYGAHSWRKLVADARKVGYTPLGGIDWQYHGHVLGDHTRATLVLTKTGGPR